MIGKETQEEVHGYVASVLDLYLQLPETPFKASSNDRRTAAALHARGVPLLAVQSALVLATARRLGRSPDSREFSVPLRSSLKSRVQMASPTIPPKGKRDYP